MDARRLAGRRDDPARFYNPAAVRTLIELGLAIFTWLSAQNRRDQQAVISFKARSYRLDEAKELDLEDVRMLKREEVNHLCPELPFVQRTTDDAATEVQKHIQRTGQYLSRSQYGTAVHWCLKQKIDVLEDPNLRAEVSYLKSQEANRYGEKDSIRVDVLEKEDDRVCVYDIKTGRSGLSAPRMAEIAGTVLRAYPGTKRIIVTEVRPGQGDGTSRSPARETVRCYGE